MKNYGAEDMKIRLSNLAKITSGINRDIVDNYILVLYNLTKLPIPYAKTTSLTICLF